MKPQRAVEKKGERVTSKDKFAPKKKEKEKRKEMEECGPPISGVLITY